MSIKLTDCNGKNTNLLENEPLVFIDETGHELLKDKKYPILGLGGICVLAKDYNELVKKPWIELKKQYFKGLNSLHEVAHFVVHTYGRQLRSVFLEVDPRLVSLMTIKKVSG